MGKLIGPQMEAWATNAMRQSGHIPPQSASVGSNIGLSWTFKIIGDWEQADGEESYHCKANRYVFHEGKYELDEKLEYRLYSPPDLDEKPTKYDVDDEVRAIYNGHWEIVAPSSGTRYLEGEIKSEAGGVYTVSLYENADKKKSGETIEATTIYLKSGEKLENGTIVGVTWTAIYGYRITHCEE